MADTIKTLNDRLERTRRDNPGQLQRSNSAGPVGILDFTLKTATGLPSNGRFRVIAYYQEQTSQTEVKQGPELVCNMNTSFRVADENTPVRIEIIQQGFNESLFWQRDFTFLEICGPNDQFLDRTNQSRKSLDLSSDDPNVRVSVDFVYRVNPEARRAFMQRRDEQELRENVALMRQVRDFITQIKQPFGFLQYNVQQVDNALHRKAQENLAREVEEEKKGDNRWHAQEKKAEQVLDSYAVKIAQALRKDVQVQQSNDIAWLWVLNGALWTYFLLSVFASFTRPDFLSFTAIVLAFMAISLPELQGRRTFRIVTAYMAVTFIYDLLWLLLLRDSDAEDAELGGNGLLVQWIASLCMMVSFFFRVVVIAVFWKVSLNYTVLVKNNAHTEGDDLENIISRYGSNYRV